MENITPKKIALFVGGTIAILAFMFFTWSMTSKPQIAPKQEITLSANEHIVGPPKSKAIIVEYSDFQCPACKQAYPTVKKILNTYKNKITFVYRHFPLTQHAYSVVAAQAAEAAGKQGKFFEMGDLLFENQETWADEKNPQKFYENYAKSLKLDLTKFKKDSQDSALLKVIKDQQNGGVALGVNSTPTFFINGVKLESGATYADFSALIDKALQEK
ncbi:hypothetical protein A3D80_02360 [Candidatus Roizmanbacteria bacterium RIFCSPHIGHO2_02_FULL_40_13b]|uniref:Thioredoxin domain-containing protein n=1 Tax=Candidatus Roizmanbacteria bacterium RIFCSPHIGHO2_01_FULL_39_24 TaxID=1802032 RepID=A0A1F7GIC3_9BACT|nr:MAG: hypothetical protein A2799_00845 [Candidatus Roizmanbacteria bacterium RIFCSPHIGHO2_01_FULL_39_24]OGK27663.1 MAG: hypothetical protein A3D80_02360 [Candidatus Roizmanbacteria bacterium RIFCSPHIGHO2_02_FULL_40_13b]OGK49331.1 MAG: hypothetical protein A3A56_02315 [Candidatus Roizmanbacteria bacterium RIFCSPLOWO2_01_FULL_40_32]